MADRVIRLVVGTLMCQKKDYLQAIELVATSKLSLTPIITHRFDFKDYLKAYETIEASNGNYLKVMVDL